MPLTDVAIRAAKPRAKPYKMTDEKGLYLLVKPGGGKLWQFKYTKGGKEKNLSIGPYPDITLAIARERRLEARRLLTEGIDPSQHKQQRAKQVALDAASSFRAVASEYLAQADKQGLAPITVSKKRWVLEQLVYPKIGDRHIRELRPSDILAVLTDIEASGRLETAKRARQYIGAVFRLAALTDRANGDPTPLLRGQMQAPKVVSYPAVIREDQFGELLRRIAGYKRPIVRLALQFIALTFVRSGELRFAKWPEIDLEDNVWRIPQSRMKMRRPHDVPLCGATRVILKQARELFPYCWEAGGYIFPSPLAPRKCMSENCLTDALRSLGYKGIHTTHGFRSSASTILNERGFRREVIEAQLAHQEENAVRRAYNRAQYWAEREKMMRDWARICTELRDSRKSARTKIRFRAHADLV